MRVWHCARAIAAQAWLKHMLIGVEVWRRDSYRQVGEKRLLVHFRFWLER